MFVATATAGRLGCRGGRAPGGPAPSNVVSGAAVGRAGQPQRSRARGVCAIGVIDGRLGQIHAMRGCFGFQVPPQPRMAWLYPRSGASAMAGQLGSARPARQAWVRSQLFRAVAPWLLRLGRSALAVRPHTSPLSTGWRGWGGGTVRRHGWRITSPHGRVHGGSRDPTHAVPPRVTRKCGFGFGFGVGPSSSCHQVHPPQPAEHPPRYTQAIASPPGPLKPCNINGLKGKSAP